MKLNRFFDGRFSICFFYIAMYLLISFVIRIALYVLSTSSIDFSVVTLFKIFGTGLFFDLGTAVFFILVYALYLLIVPRWVIGSVLDRIATYFILFITLFVTFFSFLGEFPFWEEFNTRYNFIAVDYLIYTYEVVKNIDQSYPLPLLVSVLILLCLITLLVLRKTGRLYLAFKSRPSFIHRLLPLVPLTVIAFVYANFVTNKMAESSDNTYVNELSKNGVYSFFAAYRSNELDYDTFYSAIKEEKAFEIIRNELKQDNQEYRSKDLMAILRQIKSDSVETRPNIILICIESFNADFMATFKNTEALTPNIDQLASESVLYTNMYATGTRTVRGMEAITLSVPPTPGHSIVRRPDNDHLFSIASILRQKDYQLNFFYGGDGYFDNMNNFFGGQGFNIIDRNRGNPLSDNIRTTRTNIEDDEVTFENAWGICDEDIYNKLLKISEENYKANKPFFSFVMTTSNHRPYTFPDNKIHLSQGSRKAAVKYTDYALGSFFETARTRPWFKNTVFVVMADHCASSAGKWEITIDKHHIPAIIYNLPNTAPMKVDKLVSQIDIMPTVFGYLNWNYTTALYGKDISRMASDNERALIGNYRTVGLLKDSIFTEINDRKKSNQYLWDLTNRQMTKSELKDEELKDLTISYYQTASHRFKNKSMKEK